MKATGIVRRVDSLGRVVIPKEIRHTLRIREGTALEIYTDKDGGVTFRKYSPLGDLQELAGQVCEAIHRNTGCIAAVCDTDAIVAVSGVPRRDLLDRSISARAEELLEQRRLYLRQPEEPSLTPTEDSPLHVAVCVPILCQGDLTGGLMLLAEQEQPAMEETDLKLAQTIAEFLGRQMEP